MTPEETAAKLADVDARCKSNTHRIDALDGKIDAINKLATAVEVMATELKHQTRAVEEIQCEVGRLGTKIENIEQQPAKRWSGLVDKVIYGAVGAVVAAVVGGLIVLLKGVI